jgi:hypothetical protein
MQTRDQGWKYLREICPELFVDVFFFTTKYYKEISKSIAQFEDGNKDLVSGFEPCFFHVHAQGEICCSQTSG